MNRINQLFDATKDQGELQSEVVRLGRKCVGFEVRELMGDREKVAISEQLLQEQIARRNMEVSFKILTALIKNMKLETTSSALRQPSRIHPNPNHVTYPMLGGLCRDGNLAEETYSISGAIQGGCQ